jgi:antitoxin MazE
LINFDDILKFNVYPLKFWRNIMQVAKWGNSLAVRLPASVVHALNLKEGEEIDLHVAGERSLEVAKQPNVKELLMRLHSLRGRLPADFRFDRLEANTRDNSD